MTKQPTKLDGVLRQFEIWIGLMKLGATNSSAAEHALNRAQAKQAIYDLIEYVLGDSARMGQDGLTHDEMVAVNNRLKDQRKRAKELL